MSVSVKYLWLLMLLCTSGCTSQSTSISVSIHTAAEQQPYFATFQTSSAHLAHWESAIEHHHNHDHDDGQHLAVIDSAGLTDRDIKQMIPKVSHIDFKPRTYPVPIDGTYQEQLQALRYFQETTSKNIGILLKRKLPFVLVALCECERDELVSKALLDFDLSLDKPENFLWSRSFSYLLLKGQAIDRFSIRNVFMIDHVDLPAILIDNIPAGANMEKYKLNKLLKSGIKPASHRQAITKDDIESFLKGFRGKHDLELIVRSSKIPQQNPGDKVIEVVGQTFKQIVMQNNKNVFLFAYKPGCAASTAASAVIEQLAEDVSANPHEYKNVLIAKMDATANDFPFRGIKLSHFPSAFFFPANGKTSDSVNRFLNWDDFNGMKVKHDHAHENPDSHYDIAKLKKFIQSKSV